MGPCSFIPRIEIEEDGNVQKEVIKSNMCLKLQATSDFVDRTGVARKRGDIWLYSKQGAFLPESSEEVLEVIKGTVLTDKKALLVKATNDFTD